MEQLRSNLADIQIPIPQNICQKLIFIPLLLLKMIIFLLLTILGSVLFIALIIVGVPFVSLLSPFVLYFIYLENVQQPHHSECCNFHCVLGLILTLILYPIIFGTICAMLTGLVLIYPLGRMLYPSRVFDAFDQGMTFVTLFYTSVIKCILLI